MTFSERDWYRTEGFTVTHSSPTCIACCSILADWRILFTSPTDKPICRRSFNVSHRLHYPVFARINDCYITRLVTDGKDLERKFLRTLSTPRIGYQRICGGTVASWLARWTPNQAVRVRVLPGDIVLSSWPRHFPPRVPLSMQVYKRVPANLMLGGRGLPYDGLAFHPGWGRNTPSRFMLQKAG